jgi:DNA-binding response OmpR family regulator
MTALGRPRVLVVSQDAAGAFLANLLSALHCQVERAPIAEAALEGGYDLLVLDLRPAGSDRWTVTRTIRRSGLRGPIIGLTMSPPTLVDRDRAERVGATLLPAPVDLNIVAHMLSALFPNGLPPEDRQPTRPLIPTILGA